MNLMSHQLKFVQICQQHKRYGWWSQPGTGKTIGMLAAIDAARDRLWRGKTLVLCPKSIMKSAWLADGRHFPLLKMIVCWSSNAQERRRLIASDTDVLVTNFETFRKDYKLFIEAGVRRLVVDESSKIKCFDSQISKTAHLFSDAMDEVYLLSGTPAPNNDTEFWSQMRCINCRAFGPSFWRFAYQYFSPIKRMVQEKERIIGWKPIESARPAFLGIMQAHSWSLRKEDCLDLPEKMDVIIPVDLSKDERRAYMQMWTELQVEFGNGHVMKAAVQARMMKLRQITGGVLYGDGEVQDIGHSKMDALVDLIDEIGNQPAIVWCEFTAEIDRVVVRLRAHGKHTEFIDGRVNLDDRTRHIELFQDNKLPVLVCHPAAAGHGVTLTAACFAIYYSHGFSFETYEQSRDRIHRKGQTQKCTYYHLVAEHTVDERIMRALGNRQNAHEEVMSLLRGDSFSMNSAMEALA